MIALSRFCMKNAPATTSPTILIWELWMLISDLRGAWRGPVGLLVYNAALDPAYVNWGPGGAVAGRTLHRAKLPWNPAVRVVSGAV